MILRLLFLIICTNILTVYGNSYAEEKSLQPEEKRITGNITDEDGLPLAGVAVVAKGTNIGAITDIEGNYSITVPMDIQTLVYTFIGMKTVEADINDRVRIDLQMEEDAISIEEVIAVGYVSVRQSQLTSSVSVLSSDQLEGTVTSSVGQLLQGKVGGVYVTNSTGRSGSTPEIRIRGTGSISASSAPLYVVDGIIGGIPNPSDIETITVLKDAAATGLYGSRAANGVVVITTKRGTEGRSSINFKATSGLTKANFGNLEVMNSEELYAYQKIMYTEAFEQNSYGYPDVESYMAGRGRPVELLERNIVWRDLAYRQGMQHNYDLSASGGSKNSKYYIGANYYREKGTLVGDKFERYSFRVNLDQNLAQNIKISTNIAGRMANLVDNATDHWTGGAKTAAIQNMPWDDPYDENGELVTGNEVEWTGKDINFLYPMQYNWDHTRKSDLAGDFLFTWNITNWLTFTSTNRATFAFNRNEIYLDKRTAEGSSANGSIENSYSYRNSLLTSDLLKFRKNFGDHNVNGLIGYEYNRSYYDNMYGTGNGVFPGLEVLDIASEAFALGGTKTENIFISYLSQLNYNYSNKYFISGSYRIDGSSVFGVNNRYGNFYSVGISWLAMNERFLQNVNILSNLKVRASYGSTGNSNIDDFLHLSLYEFESAFNFEPAGTLIRAPNPNLTWEKAYTGNIGFDLGLFNRIDLIFDLYNTTNKDLLMAVPQPITTGFNTFMQNVGSVRNRGAELTLSTQNITGAFLWSTDFNISFNRNKVLKLINGEDIITSQGGADSDQILREGEDRYSWYLRKWVGVDPDNGDPLWEKLIEDENGNVIGSETTNNYNDATLQIVGSASPKLYGGMRNNLSYKGFTLDFYFNFVQGYLINHSRRRLYDSDGSYSDYNQMKLYKGWSRWENPGDIATHPKPMLGGNKSSLEDSSRHLEDGSYLKFRNVTFSYNLPSSVCNRIKIQSLRIFFSGDNLYTITDFSGYDPEVEVAGSVGNQYSVPKRYLFGVEIGL